MKQIVSTEIITPELSEGAILNELMEGFREDYLCLHCLLKIHKPTRFMEIGTHKGTGTKIIKNALGEASEVISLDLSAPEAILTNQYPESGKLGENCDLPFKQIMGNSLNYDFTWHYPINGWFIDGEHDYQHVYRESREAIKSKAQIIIYHDADMHPVFHSITDAFKMPGGENYELFRIIDTRIAYAKIK